ncbi:fibronectin type III domain-containing protein [Candidatus Woesebacteria bacterium]|nr:fibronectin type III domain-containing protein [Candidatus Woesebacteria bacterium]
MTNATPADSSAFCVSKATSTSNCFNSIQDAINAASNGDTIRIENGTYTLSSTIQVNKEVKLIGESRGSVIIDASGLTTSYAMRISADNVVVRKATFLPPSNAYTIHVSNTPGLVSNLKLESLTVENAKKTPFDVHGVDGGILTGLSAKNSSAGNGVSLSGSSNITLENITTANNAWGGIALYNSSYTSPNRETHNITLLGHTFNVSESNPLYAENELGLTIHGIDAQGFEYTVTNDQFRSGAENFVFYQRTYQDAINYATILESVPPGNEASEIQEITPTAPPVPSEITIFDSLNNDVGCSAATTERNIRVDWSDEGSTAPDFSHYQYDIKDKDNHKQPTDSFYNNTIRDQDGEYKFRVHSVDVFGNVSEATPWCNITLDREAPTMSNIKMFVNGAEKSIAKAGDTIRIEADAQDNLSGIDRVQIWVRDWPYTGQQITAGEMTHISGDTYAFEFTLPATYSNSVALNQTNLGNYFNFRPWDNAGNSVIGYRNNFTADLTGPTITVKDSSIGNGGNVFKKVDFKLYDLNKVDKVEINGVVKDLSNNKWSDVNNVKAGSLGAVEGKNTIVAYDVVGNTTTYEFFIDNAGPTITVKDSSIGNGENVFKQVDFKLYDNAKVDKVEINGVLKDLSDNKWSDVNGVKAGKFGAVEGENTIVAYDVLGNTSSFTFTIDNTGPTITVKEESIGDGGNTFQNVSFKLFDEYKIDRVEINGVVKDLTDNKWSDVNAVRPGIFGAVEGLNTIVAFDTVGNSTTYEFYLDTTGPAVPTGFTLFRGYNTVPGNEIACGGYTNTNKISFSWDANSESDILGYQFGTRNNPTHQLINHPTTTKNGTMTINSNPFYFYTLMAQDMVGNRSALTDQCELTYDDEVPETTITTPEEESSEVTDSLEITFNGTTTDNFTIDFVTLASAPYDGEVCGEYTVFETIDNASNNDSFTWSSSPWAPGSPGNYCVKAYGTDLATNEEGSAIVYIDYDPQGTITGAKFNDLDQDGIWDENEPALANWEIVISAIVENEQEEESESTESGALTQEFATVTTDENGEYTIDVPVGEYLVSEIQQEGWEQTAPEDLFCTLTVTLDETAECTFGNYEIPEDLGSGEEPGEVLGSTDSGSSNNGGSTSPASPPVCSAATPGVPLNLQVANSGANTVTLTWQAASGDVSHYALEFIRISDGARYGANNIGNVTSYTITNLSGQAAYRFELFAVNDCKPGDRAIVQSGTITGAVIDEATSGRPTGEDNQVLGVTTDETSDSDENGEIASGVSEENSFLDNVLGASTENCSVPGWWWSIIAIYLVALLLIHAMFEGRVRSGAHLVAALATAAALYGVLCMPWFWIAMVLILAVMSEALPWLFSPSDKDPFAKSFKK